LKSKEPKQPDSKLNVACLASGFYPRNISLDVPQGDVVYDLKTPPVTSEGTYSAMRVAGVEADVEVTCTAVHQGKNAADSSVLLGLMSCDTTVQSASSEFFLPSDNPAGATDVKMEKVNTLFVTILGLRILLAKSFAINAVMSLRLLRF
ncbi:TRDC protein, partial [Turnix velox]|nr:TRDC protein [Turnix velox]